MPGFTVAVAQMRCLGEVWKRSCFIYFYILSQNSCRLRVAKFSGFWLWQPAV